MKDSQKTTEKPHGDSIVHEGAKIGALDNPIDLVLRDPRTTPALALPAAQNTQCPERGRTTAHEGLVARVNPMRTKTMAS